VARKRRRTTTLTGAPAEFVARERVVRIATTSAHGQPHLVPVCHVVAGGKLYVGTGDDDVKIRNLRANPRITVTADLYSDDWASIKGVMIQGRAKVIARGPAFQRARKRLYAKYPQYPKLAALAPSDSAVVEITPTNVYAWGFDD